MPGTPRTRRWLMACAVIAAAAVAPAAQAAQQYSLTLTKSPTNTRFFGLNAAGDVFGKAFETGTKATQAFLLRNGSTKLQFLGAPGDPTNSHSVTSPEGINRSDAVVGTATDLNTGAQHAVEWQNSSTPTDIGALPGIANNYANPDLTAINDDGLITGFGRGLHGNVGFTVNGSQVTPLPVLPSNGVDAEPLAVNNSGLIVGWGDTTSQGPIAVAWQNGAINVLGELPGSLESKAFAVNGLGEAVGGSLAPDRNVHAVAYLNGQVIDLNVPGSGFHDAQANAINDSGVIVGSDGFSHAFTYQNGGSTDLNTLIPTGSGVTLVNATGVNASGVIVGTAVPNGTSATYGFKLTPVTK